MGKVKSKLWHESELDEELYYQENDMHISKMTTSKYIKKEDVETPILVTIKHLDQQDVSMENEPPEMKWTLHFTDHDKPLVLNMTNIQLCSIACGSEDTDDWAGKQIVLFNDPTIMYAGKVTGGVRVRAPKPQQAPAEKAAEFNDDVGF